MSKGADGRRPSCLTCEPPPAQMPGISAKRAVNPNVVYRIHRSAPVMTGTQL